VDHPHAALISDRDDQKANWRGQAKLTSSGSGRSPRFFNVLGSFSKAAHLRHQMNRKTLSLALFVVVASLLVFALKYFHPWPDSHAAEGLKSASVSEIPPVSIPNDGFAGSGQAMQNNASPEQLMDAAWQMRGDGRIPAASQAFRHWTDLDLDAAVSWLTDHEADPAADHLITDVLLKNSVIKENFEVELRWAEVLSDHDLSAETIGQILLTQGIKAPAESIHYVNGSHILSPEQKERLRMSLSQALPR
jgi:hypothetical protein